MPIIKVENGYIYKKTTKNTAHKTTLFFFLLLLCSVVVISACFFAFTKFDLTATFGLNKYVIYEGSSFFAVSVEETEYAKELSEDASMLKLQDGAGYILKRNDKCYLIANSYSSIEQAQNVAANLTNYDAEVLELKFDRLVLSAQYTSEQIDILKHSISLVNRFFDRVQDISVSFDRAEILDAEARQKLQVFKETCQLEKENLSKAFSNGSDVVVTYVKIFQNEVISNLSSLIVSQNLSGDMKYIMVSTLVSFETFQKNIKK